MWFEYLTLGFDHILDFNGYDHILFVAVLCALYTFREWKKVLFLITAFTVGHSLTLALSSLNIISVNTVWVERAIPVTIILTAVSNLLILWKKPASHRDATLWQYLFTLAFGFIHGMGFSGYFKAILGRETSVFQPLLAFNVGVEIGQILVVTGVLMLGGVLTGWLKMPKTYWTAPVSVLAAGVAIYLLMQR